MTIEPTQIVLIDDNLESHDPLIIELQEIYGKQNVILRRRSSEGLNYIFEHLTSKMIVLLDLDLGAGEPHGAEVFDQIRSKTSLIYVIIITAKLFEDIRRSDLIKFINNDALAIVNNTDSISDILRLVGKAAHELETRIDCVLEEWISKRTNDELKAPYVTSKSGKTYSLEELIVEIRMETEIGKQLEKSILQLAINLFTTDSRQLSD